MAKNNGTSAFLGGLLSNAVWEWIKALGGGLVSSLTSAIFQYFRHRSVDWWGVLILGITTAVVIGIILWRENKQQPKASKDTAPLPVQSTTDALKEQAPSSPQLLREQVLELAGDLCALLMEYGKELEPPFKDDGFAGLGPLPSDDPEIKAEFISAFGNRVSGIKSRLGERGLLGEKFNFSSIGDALDNSLGRNADGVREIIKCLALAAKIIDEKSIRGISFSFASGVRSASTSTPSKDEAFELIWKLKEFHNSLSPCPGIPNSLPNLTTENADDYASGVCTSIRAWSSQIRHSYIERFSVPVNELIHKLGSKGLDVRELEEYSKCVETKENVSNVIEALQKVASGLEGK